MQGHLFTAQHFLHQATAQLRHPTGFFLSCNKEREHLNILISIFKKSRLIYPVSASDTPIQVVIIPGNEEVKKVAAFLQEHKFDVRAILYPTVPKGQERLRIVFHAFNTIEEVEQLIEILS